MLFDEKCFGYHHVFVVCLCHVLVLIIIIIIIYINTNNTNNNTKPLYLTPYDGDRCEVLVADENVLFLYLVWLQHACFTILGGTLFV
jgi:hypothetical protein